MQIHTCARCGLAHAMVASCPVVISLPVPVISAPLAVGTVVGRRFRIESIAHRSRMSTVYRATDQRNQVMLVALKEFNAAGLAPEERTEALAWLAREAGLLSTLQDPRLPTLLAAFSEGERHYLAMPFLYGQTLEDLIASRGPQPEMLVLSWGRHLAELLSYLHTQQPPVVHRDLKPANTLLQPDGTLVLLDLGVARSLAVGLPGTAVGTPGYAPPEQYQGLADERSDLYALGATLHRALTGYDPEHAPPFRHPAVQDLNPSVSDETAALVNGLLELSAERRPPSARVLAADLVTVLREVHCGPLYVMYRQILACLVVALAMSSVVYIATTPAIAQRAYGTYGFKHADPLGDALRVVLIFAPGLLCFLPLVRPRLRALATRSAPLRLYRDRAAWLLALCWLMPLAIWLLDLDLPIYGTNLVLVRGQAPLAVPLVLCFSGLAAALLLRQRYCLHRLQLCKPLRWYHLLLRLCGLVALGFFILMVQSLTIYGMG